MNTFTIKELEQIQALTTNNKELHEKVTNMISASKSCDEVLYKFYWDCGRQGDVEGIFKAKKSFIESVIGNEIYFGEILGKHSEVYGTLDEEDLEIISEDPIVVMNTPESGYNPLEYMQFECSICKCDMGIEELSDEEKCICYDCAESEVEFKIN